MSTNHVQITETVPNTAAELAPQRLKGPVPLQLQFSHGRQEHTVPDPDELPRGLALSPSHKYLLRFIRENMESDCSADHSNSSVSLPDSQNTNQMTPSARASHDPQSVCTVSDIGFESAGGSTSQTTLAASATELPSSASARYKMPPEFSPNGIEKVLGRVARAIDIGRVTENRPYRFHSRVKRSQNSPSRGRKRRLERALRGGNPFLNPSRGCCKRYSCFKKMCPHYLYQEFKAVNTMNKVQAKRYLISLWSISDKKWYLNGHSVCSRFLERALGFSNDLQCSVKGTPGARAAPTARRLPKEVNWRTKRWYISNFLLKLARRFAEAMPHKEEFALPIFTKTLLWYEFQTYWEDNVAVIEGKAPSKNYFLRIWKLYVGMVKVQKKHGFTVCSRCEMLRSEMAKHLLDEETLTVLLDQFAKHLKFVEKERDGYEMRQSMAEENPRKVCSIILDGADQKNYGLPHFPKQTKSDVGHKLKVKVIGGLEHTLRGNEQLSLYAMTEEYATGANHVIEVAHRMLQRKKEALGKLPHTLFIQVDNCSRENKNRYFMAYFQSLIHLGVFKMIQISFLPIGHTHADIDQAFSAIASHLNICEALTLADMLLELGRCYARRTKAFDLTRIINYSELCDMTGCLTSAHHFSEYRFFRFLQKEVDGNAGLHSSTCDVKVQEGDEWAPFPTSRAEGFLKFVPNFRDTPNTKTKELPNFTEVSKCLDSAEQRVTDDEKMVILRDLRDKVFQVREEEFHWNIESCFEMHGDYLPDGDAAMELLSEHVEDQLRPNLGFNPDDLVAVVAEDDEHTEFWIARVKNVSEVDGSGRVKMIQVRWYVPSGNDPWTAKYTPAWKLVNGERTVYEANVDVACVILCFNSLTTARKLRVNDKKAIKQMLDAN